MWCSTCQQDVPGLGSTSEGNLLRCGKCGEVLATAHQPIPAVNQPAMAAAIPTAANENVTLEKLLRLGPLSNEDWAIEAELRGVQRLMSSLKTRSTDVAEALKLHAPHAVPKYRKMPGSFAASANDQTDEEDDSPRHIPVAPSKTHLAAWAILSIGLAIFACGAVLLGWSLVAKRPDLWPVGMPLALIGQAGLILGLILQLDGLWSSSRQTAAVLNELDGELKNVRQATTLLTTSHSGGAQSFYLHLAEGASPQMLLADLKGQMDLLAQQMAKQG
jgi:hypothetical protein